MSRYVDMPGHGDNISLGDDHILRSEFVVDLSDISHIECFDSLNALTVSNVRVTDRPTC